MAIVRATGVFIGVNERLGASIANNVTLGSSGMYDVLGNNTSVGEAWIWAVFSGSGTVGTLDLTFNPQLDNTPFSGYQKVNPDFSLAPISGVQRIPLGKRPIARFMYVTAKNNATGANLANVSILYELEQLS